MPTAPLFIGQNPLHTTKQHVQGEFVTIENETYYRIRHVDQMRPFFMSLVSSSDHWLFISSNGALTAGRRNPEHALFPYYTDDKIHDSAELTGSKSILIVHKNEKRFLWEPFSDRYQGAYQIQRNLYKHIYGNKIIFEEINEDLGINFSYAWESSREFGFVKRSWVQNLQPGNLTVEILDGIQNILPYGVNLPMQTELSTLVDAYKKNELEKATGLGIYMLSSILVDRPEPSEALKATTVWSVGLSHPKHLLSSLQLKPYRQGLSIQEEVDIRAERGAYFVQATMTLDQGRTEEWYIVAEINQGPSEVAAIQQRLAKPQSLLQDLKEDISLGTDSLEIIVAISDGLQLTGDRLSTARHFSNTLFNVMRGGIYHQGYHIERDDFQAFIHHYNHPTAKNQTAFLQSLPSTFELSSLLNRAKEEGHSDLLRLAYEYLPLTFSRRHGDPSRPWNFFSIESEDEAGNKILNYQGNWRDIFQNWEALCRSYPAFIESIIFKFVNATTADGYNPYRITRKGIDWEVTDPSDPWSFIGYWGDHQIIYLLKLLELSRDHHPGLLTSFLNRDLFVYANVPYRIKSYDQLLQDPHDTIEFDEELAEKIDQRVQTLGADGKLLWGKDGQITKATLAEKLLVTVLAKLSNFIPEAGIWMNTQRPEWNDANNALVGYGVSMVTLYYLRRFLVFSKELFSSASDQLNISEEIADLLQDIGQTLDTHQSVLSGNISDKNRKSILDGLGEAGNLYRERIYQQGFSGSSKPVLQEEILDFIDLALRYLDHSIQTNKRPDDLYHSYNLMSVQGDAVPIRHLYEMLEGQVAVLSSGFLSVEESISVLKALKTSLLYREDQYSYLLYPNRQLARFTAKNNIPAHRVQDSALLQQLLADQNKDLIEQDVAGAFHFNGTFRNAESIKEVLSTLADNGYGEAVAKEQQLILDIFEEMFDHQSFTGRSGTFYGYEGLGCIYWHMVSKLLLAVCETYYRAIAEGESLDARSRLIEFYYDIRAGIGLNKNPEVYGAFPTDPYSHTPGNAGAQQPGMTGQVKEDILSRWGELGVVIQDGCIQFQPVLLRKEEFLNENQLFKYHTSSGERQSLDIEKQSIAFTYCQIPVVYKLSEQRRMLLSLKNGNKEEINGLKLSPEKSALIFGRTGDIQQIEVYLMPLI